MLMPAEAPLLVAVSPHESVFMVLASAAAVATIVELLEESGLPPVCVAVASSEDARRPLGQVLAEAVQVLLIPRH